MPAAAAPPVLAVRTDEAEDPQTGAPGSYEAEFRKIISVDVLMLADLAIDVVDATKSRDLYDVLFERDRAASIIVTSNRGLR